jgi:hypothetical protein
MPPPLNVNRESVKTLVVAHGVAEAHRLTGIPLGTIKAWSARFKWLKCKPDPIVQPLCNRSPADALAATLQADNEATKLGFSRAARKAAEHAGKLKPEAILKRAKALRNMASTASTIHGWQEQKAGGVNVFGRAVVITDEQVADLRRRLARLRGEDEDGG